MRWLAVVAAVVAVVACSNAAAPPQAAAPSCANGAADACLRDCDGGSNGACEKLEIIELRRGEAGRRDVAALVKRLCEGGRRYFCPSFAFALARGDGIAADRVRATELFQTTCQDDPHGCSEFGNLLSIGLGVAKDPELGTHLLELACKLHDANACNDLVSPTRRN